ncbi:MAG TPA: helix-turn-helix domain-containing protein [Chitinophagales bacterium]|nr:helix-turn-helix domain-containing protein [Chitinophagales bacterium]
METQSIQSFYRHVFGDDYKGPDNFLFENNGSDIGHFNVFSIADVHRNASEKATMPYNRRSYYKISLIKGRNRVEYADKTVDIEKHAVLFATPKIPYKYNTGGPNQQGHFCVFTRDFITKTNAGVSIDSLPVFSPNSDFVYQLNATQYKEIEAVFSKMQREIVSDYPYKYDLLRNYLMELVHYGQKLKPITPTDRATNASVRIFTLFIELLERQFPIENTNQTLQLRTPKQFADTLSVHVNHLNRILKETTGKTTTEIIASRITQEAKILLKQTNWNISEIAYSLGFEEVAHFSNSFKKHTALSPVAFRG